MGEAGGLHLWEWERSMEACGVHPAAWASVAPLPAKRAAGASSHLLGPGRSSFYAEL